MCSLTSWSLDVKHLVDKTIEFVHVFFEDFFEVLKKCMNKFNEMLHIKQFTPSLNLQTDSIRAIACEYSRLSFAPATTCETRRQTTAIHRQKFHTDDVNLPALKWHN